MKKILILFAFVLVLKDVSAQTNKVSCAQVLRLAQSTYEQGRLHELPTLMSECFAKSADAEGFTKQQRVDAYRYLTLAYIYLEEPEKADEAMLNLLRTDHYYVPNEQVEPAEFIGLYKTFRTTPVFSVGAKFGVNGVFPILGQNYYVTNTSVGNGKYGTKVAFQAGIVFEKQMFIRSKNKFLRRLTFAPEILYTIHNLSYANDHVMMTDSVDLTTGEATSAAKSTADLSQTWLEFNPIFQYATSKDPKTSSLNPYIGFGPGISYLLSAPGNLVTTRENSVGTVSGPAVELKNSYKKIVPSLTIVAGIKYQFGSIKLTAEGRVNYGLAYVINGPTRSNSEALRDYGFTMSDVQQVTAMVNLGFVFPYFNPIKKKIKK